MQRLILAIGLAGLLSFAAWAQTAKPANDVLYLQDGRERVGSLIDMTADSIVFQVRGESAPQTFPRSDVQRLDLSKARQGDTAQKLDELDDALLKRVVASAPAKVAYPDSGYVTLYRSYDYTLAPDGGWTLVEREIEKILLERGKDEANVARHFKAGEETLDIDFARTIATDGTLTPLADAGVEVASVHPDVPEYDKLKQVKFALRQVQIDAIIDYQVTRRRTQTSLLEPWWAEMQFREDEPVLEVELRVHAPSDMPVKWQEERLGQNVTFTREEHGGQVTYQWVGKNCQRIVPEPAMPPRTDFLPRVCISRPMEWEAIGTEYSAAVKAAATPSAELKARVAELTAGATAPAEKAARVYQDFLASVRQIWVWPAQFQYAPRPVADVFAKRAGNSIDKAAVLAAMFREAGLPAGVVLVRPQTAGRVIDGLPNIKQFTDAVVAVDLPDGRRYLGLTDESVRFGQLPSHYQGTTGMYVDTEQSKVVTIPLKPPAEEQLLTRYHLDLQADGNLKVDKTETLMGNAEIDRRNSWKDMKDEELRRTLEVELTAMYPKARLLTYNVENLHDVTKPLKFTQTYMLEDYGMRVGKELLVFQLPEVSYSAAAVGKDEREFPLRWYLQSETAKEMTITLPAGYRVYYGGRNFEADGGAVQFTAEFSQADNALRYKDAFVQTALELPANRYADYKKAIETQARVSKEWIVLEATAQ